MNKAETINDFKKHVNRLLADGEKKSWIEAESRLANRTLTQILEWGDGPELIPMKASTLARLQDFNKRIAMGDLIKFSEVKARKRGRKKEATEVRQPEKVATENTEIFDSFFGMDQGNGKDQAVKIPITDHSYVPQVDNVVAKPNTRHKLTPQEMEQIKRDLKMQGDLNDPDITIDKAIVLLNRACKEIGISCEIIIKSA
jgi:hypothetical protein